MTSSYEDLPLPERLHAFGTHPVDPAVQSRHLTTMASSGSSPRPTLARRLQFAAALVVAFVALSTGLAVAQVDAGPVTAVGKQVAGVVGVDINDGKVTHGTDRYYGPECVQVADGKGAKNHGQYLKWVREHQPEMLEAAKASKCGKPLNADADEKDDAKDGAKADDQPK